jgi:gamma-glutamyl hydrolase
LQHINGALFTGGGADFYESDGVTLTPFAATAKIIFDESVTAAGDGEWWPIWGTCLGHELVLTLAAGQKDILSAPFDAENISFPLNLLPGASTSRFLGSAPDDVLQILSTQYVTMNSHQAGVTMKDFAAYPGAANRFTVLSTNVDRGGKQFISTTQANSMPIYTTQWHPEKPLFEWWDTQNVNHTTDSVYANSWTPRFFVSEARKNTRSFSNASAEAAALIYNYPAIFSAATDPGFQQVYLFN